METGVVCAGSCSWRVGCAIWRTIRAWDKASLARLPPTHQFALAFFDVLREAILFENICASPADYSLPACSVRWDLSSIACAHKCVYDAGHCFADWNHVDCCTMVGRNAHNENSGRVAGMSFTNRLGAGITKSSVPTHGAGGSWCTCQVGAAQDRDVCHVQFNSSIAFKLVWCPQSSYTTFVLVNDDGKTLRRGAPTGHLPPLQQRVRNYDVVKGSKYARGCVPPPATADAPAAPTHTDAGSQINGTCLELRVRGLTCTRCQFSVEGVLRMIGGVARARVALDYSTFDEGVATVEGQDGRLPTARSMGAELAHHGPYTVLSSKPCESGDSGGGSGGTMGVGSVAGAAK